MNAFPRSQHLTAIAIAYRNPDIALVADAVLPRVPVGLREFGWFEYDLADHYTRPNTHVGRMSRVNRVESQGVKQIATCEDYGIDVVVSIDDVNNAPSGVSLVERATMRATDFILLDREARVADMVFDPAAYPSTNKRDLEGQFSDPSSKPLTVVFEGLDKCLMRPNALLFGQEAWTCFSMHPDVVKAAHGNSGDVGRASRERVAEIFEVNEVLVGSSFLNMKKPGEIPSLERVWGPHILAFYRDRSVDTSGGVTFGFTAQFGERVAGSKREDLGLYGVELVRSGESVKELIVAPHAAFFFENAAAL
jgi:hypothetical protein